MDSSLADLERTSKPGPISVAVDPVALVVTECITVTSAMRKHARWAHSSVSAILGVASASRPESAARQGSRDKDVARATTRLRGLSVEDDTPLASRWGLRGKKGQSMQDNPLLSAFARLRSDLKQCKDIHAVDAPAILHPFLQVIRSSSTSAPITSLALIAITKFLAYGIISHESPQLPLAMQKLSSAVTHCRFEASDSATDEIVLFRILKLMESMINGPGGNVIGDESMCEMMETGISMCCQVRLSELLRRSAEVSMVSMCQTIFQRLKSVEVEPEEDDNPLVRKSSLKKDADPVKMDPSVAGDMLAENKNKPEAAAQEKPDKEAQSQGSRSLDVPRDKGGGRDSLQNPNSSQLDLSQQDLEDATQIQPYSLPSIRELFRVLVDLLDPHEKAHNDTMRVMALRIVDVALEVAGPSIANHPSLASLAKDTLCRHLFQLVRSENISILNESLRVAGTLLSTCRKVLKLQQELFLSYLVACLHPRVEIPQEQGIDPALYDGVPQAPRLVKPAASQSNSGRSTPVPVKDRQRLGMEGGSRKPDARETMVESVGALVRIPSFMAELFVNYDCETDRSDLCVDMVGLLARNAFPDAATWSTTNVPPLCLDALLGYVQGVADRLDDEPDFDGIPDIRALRRQRDTKKLIITGTSKFNESTKGGIAFLASQGLIKNPDDPVEVVKFLKGTTRVDKKVLGEFLSKKSNEQHLSAFMDLFDFSGQRLDEALRELLNSFRLPGEAPLIARIVTEFSSRYHEIAQPKEIIDKDGVFVLTYATIMLNTDQHNPNIKAQNRMTLEAFSKNLRGVNNGQDFAPEYLQEIYESIRTNEIILPEEHDNKNSFDHAWKELLVKIQSTRDLTICNTNVFDADMFAATWKPVVATLTYVFLSATDDTVFSRVVTGFDQCAQIAAKYNINDALDHIVFSLSSISSLAAETLPNTSLNTEVQAGEKSVMVSETAVRFGRDFKAQLATVVLFRLVVGNEHTLRDGWSNLVLILFNLFVNSLINTSYTSLAATSDLPPIPLQGPAQIIDRNKQAAEGGLFSAFTSYVSSFANDEPPEPSDQEIEYTLCTVDCIHACSFDTFFKNVGELPLDSLTALFRTLLRRLPEDSSPKIMIVKPEIPAPTPVRPNGQKSKPAGLAYDPGHVFILEFATLLAIRDEQTVAALGQELSVILMGIIRDPAHNHPVTLSRAVYYMLLLLRASHNHDFVRVPVVLHAISKFEEEQIKFAATFTMRGLLQCLSGPTGLRNEIVNAPDFWFVLQALHANPETSQPVFDVLEDVVTGPTASLTADYFDPVVSLLNEFATAPGVMARNDRRREQEAQRNRQPKPKAELTKEAVARGVKAMKIVNQITNRVPTFIQQSQLEPAAAWKTYWSPPFRTLQRHSSNPSRQIRAQALDSLRSVMLSPSLGAGTSDGKSAGLSTDDATTLFTGVLFPLVAQLLKPEVWHTDPGGMGETRLQAVLLCCKVYLRFLEPLMAAPAAKPAPPDAAPNGDAAAADDAAATQANQLPPGDDPTAPPAVAIWHRILDLLERLLKSGAPPQPAPGAKASSAAKTEALEEAVPESVKNVLLVMRADGLLVRPEEAARDDGGADEARWKRALWEGTRARLERFLPELLDEVVPAERADSAVGSGPAEEANGGDKAGAAPAAVEASAGEGEGEGEAKS